MNNTVNRKVVINRRQRILAASSLFALLAGGNAMAQTVAATDNETQEIVVTGTRIRGVAPVGAPVVVVDQKEIVDSGLNTTADILHDIPQITSLGASQSTLGANQNANLNTNRDNAINIRGLGTQATLTLLDGRRTPLGGSSGLIFDPSSIPTIAIKNIDVVADGASAIYGSDAVAGVANIILRKDFEGAEVAEHYGTGSDYNTEKVDAILGRKWDTGSVMISGEFNRNSELTQSKRSNLFNCNETALGASLGCTAYGTPAGNVKVPAGASIPAGIYGLPAGSSGTGITAAQLGPENFFTPASDTTLDPKSSRKSVVYNLQQQANDDINFWTEGYFTQNDVSFPNGQYSASGNVTAANPGFIPLGPGVTSEAATLGLDPYVGPITRSGYERAYQLAVGTDITLPYEWAFNIDYEHNYNYEYTVTPGINTTAEAAAFTCTTPGLCFNPFGLAAGNASAVNSFIGTAFFQYTQIQDLVNGKFDGPIYSLPGGDIKLAIGGEYHRDTLGVYSHNTINTASTSITAIAANLGLERSVGSVFAELNIPIVGANNELSFVKRLDIDVAGRYDTYSDVGSTFNPKYAFRWKPIDDLTVHGDLGTSFRAPTLCDTNSNCTAGTLAVPGAYGAGLNVITTLGGNPAVKPETARTWTVGGEYMPAWASGVDVSVNYFHINYKNVIGTPAQNNPAALTNPIYAPFVIRNPTQAQINAITSQPWFSGGLPFAPLQGVVNAIVMGTRSNAGAVQTDGLDLSAGYHWSSSLGEWTVEANATYLLDYNYELLAGAGFINRLNQANFPVNFHGRTKFGWSNDNFAAIAYVNYTAGYNVVGLAYAAQNTPVNPYTTLDMTFLYKTGSPSYGGGYADNITLTLAIQNVLDTAPPFALITASQQFDSQQASALGRVITFSLRKSF